MISTDHIANLKCQIYRRYYYYSPLGMRNVGSSLSYKHKGSESSILTIHKKADISRPDKPPAPNPPGRVSRFVQPAALPRRYLHQWTPHAVHDGRSRHRPAAGRCTRQPGKQARAAFPLLRPRLPRQQGRDGLAGREAAFDDGQHGAADGQVHAQRLGAGHDGGAAGHAFGDVAQGGQDVGQ